MTAAPSLRAVALLALVATAGAVRPVLDRRETTPQAAQTGRSSWISDDEIAGLPPQLTQAIARDPFTRFRLVNRRWNERVCAAFASEAMPTVRLHGDAHVEQYAVTQKAFGLDDFDDSAEGPAAIDMVRFIGSLQLAARQRGWHARVDGSIAAFLDGYRRALDNPTYAPPIPRVVVRLRARPVPTPAEFLASVEARMEPIPAPVVAAAQRALEQVSRGYPDRPPGYFTLKRMGALQMGVGSYTAAKFLMRVEGPTPAPDDDVVLEAKEVSDLAGVACISSPNSTDAVRVILGTQQIGRLDHSVLTIFPGLAAERATRREWWLRSWDRTYLEVQISDLRSVEELEEIARDAGAQLGSTSVAGGTLPATAAARQRALNAVVRVQGRVRQVAADLSNQMLVAWRR